MKRTFLVVSMVFLCLVVGSTVNAGDFELVGGVDVINISSTQEYSASETIENIEVEREGEETTQGRGGFAYYGGARYFFSDKIGIGAGYDMQTVKSGTLKNLTQEETELEYGYEYEYVEKEEILLTDKINGPYGELVFKLNDFISLNGKIAYYNFTQEGQGFIYMHEKDTHNGYEYEYEDKMKNTVMAKGKGLGYNIGANLSYPLTDDVNITGNFAYTLGNIALTELYNIEKEKLVGIGKFGFDEYTFGWNGFRFGAGISINF